MQNITSYSKNQNLFFDPSNVSEIYKLAEYVKTSQLLPPTYRNNTPNIIAGMMICLRLGLDPILGLEELNVINDKVTMGVKTMRSLVLGHPECEDIIETFDKDKLIATCTVKRKNRTPVVCSFSKEDAVKAKLWEKEKSSWKTYPNKMLSNRACGWAFIASFGDLFKGVLPREEVEDYEDFKYPLKPVNKVDNIDKGYDTETLNYDFNETTVNPKPVIKLNDNDKKIKTAIADELYKPSQICIDLEHLILDKNIDKKIVSKWLEKANVRSVLHLSDEIASKCINYIEANT